MNTNKSGVRALVSLCVSHGVRHVVISPGSRNAPITIAFSKHPQVKTYSIVDERSAGFVALGMAMQLKMPTAVVCTSGSALLNYTPAVVEAFYQHIPLIVISADRPNEYINQGLGQSIEQQHLLQNITKKAVSLPNVNNSYNQQWYTERLINEALNAAIGNKPGPVHINVPLSEPLYELSDAEFAAPKIIRVEKGFDRQWHLPSPLDYKKICLLIGQNTKGSTLNQALIEASNKENIQVWCESTSNIAHPNFVDGIDKMLASFDENDKTLFKPELLITIGDAVVSKRIKGFLSTGDYEHWHVGESETIVDTYQHLTKIFVADEVAWLTAFNQQLLPSSSSFKSIALQRRKKIESIHQAYAEKVIFSDFKAYHAISAFLLNKQVDIHVANSAAIRYMQLFERSFSQNYYCNRGASGIDGSTSTAVGSAMMSSNPTWFITGDISFLYDSNAFWNNHLPDNLKIVVINNAGGGIFRFIDGPSKTEVLDEYLETHHTKNAAALCSQHEVNYTACHMESEILEKLNWLENQEKTAVLEIFTPRLKNPDVLTAYFAFIKDKTHDN